MPACSEFTEVSSVDSRGRMEDPTDRVKIGAIDENCHATKIIKVIKCRM